MPTELRELSNALAGITQRVAASTVAVHTDARGSSSGVIWGSGVIVTVEHALTRDEEIEVTLPDASVAPATLVGRDPSTDLAVLKCTKAGSPSHEIGEAGALKPGSLTMVVGRTRASGPVAALGVVSLFAPERRTWTGASLAPYIRLDVGLQQIAAGGAVVDSNGRIAGIATPRFTRFGAIAIPALLVQHVVDTLLRRGHVPHGYLGVGLQAVRLPDTLRESLGRKEKTAAIVLEVQPEGPAHKAGIVIGDILVSLAGQDVTQLENVQSQLHGENIGKALTARIVRGGALREISVVVDERPHGGK